MSDNNSMTWRLRLKRLPGWIAEFLLIAAGLRMVFSGDDNLLAPMLVWDIVALLYIGVGMVVVRRRTARGDEIDGFREMGEQNRPFSARLAGIYFAFGPMLFSVLGLTAALQVLFVNTSVKDDDIANGLKALAALAMVFAWILLHMSYSRRYQWLYRRDNGGLEFPGDADKPREADFLYFAMTLGSSFATSDVNVMTTKMRWHVLVHSGISFFYNAIVLAVAFRVLTGG